MKLIVDIESWYDRERGVRRIGCSSRFSTRCGLDMVEHKDFSQAEEVAMLTEISADIERLVSTYDSKDPVLMPKVVKKSLTEPLTE